MMDYDEGGEFDGTQDEPRHLLLAREAEMYQEGGHNLAADPQRAGSTRCGVQNFNFKKSYTSFCLTVFPVKQ